MASLDWLAASATTDSRVCVACELEDFRDGPGRRELSADAANRSSALETTAAGKSFCGIFFDTNEEERLRIGRALHDSTGQLLLTLSLNLAQIRASEHDHSLDPVIDQMSETVGQILREVRDFAFLEYPVELRSSGLAVALSTFIKGFAKRTGLRTDFHTRSLGEIPDSRTALALLRIGQEALVNAYRHAKASRVDVTLGRTRAGLRLAIIDDGVGMPTAASRDGNHGIGLVGMSHRAERLGGTLTIERLKHGTKVVATIPVPSDPAQVGLAAPSAVRG